MIPKPKKLTEEDLVKIDEESRQWVKAVVKGTETLEQFTSEDLKTVIKNPDKDAGFWEEEGEAEFLRKNDDDM